MGRKVRSLLTLTPADWAALVSAWWALLAVDLGLRLLRYSVLVDGLNRWTSRRQATARDRTEARTRSRRMVRMAGIAARHHLYPMNCLRQALAVHALLGRQGIPTELKIGVQRGEDGLSAHAWVEIGGIPVGEPADLGSRYLPLLSPRG